MNDRRSIARKMGLALNGLGFDRYVRTVDFENDTTVMVYKGARRVKDNLIAYGIIGVVEPGQPDREMHIFTADDVHRITVPLTA